MMVLIETYWNVNRYAPARFLMVDASLNRNILECKFLHLQQKHPVTDCLNRNILECKFKYFIKE